MSECLEVESQGSIRIVRLNRPEQLNAASPELHRRLAEIWPELAADSDARAVVLTGAGRAFSGGGDLDLISDMGTDAMLRQSVLHEAKRIVQGMVDFPLPVVAAVNGPAVGLGCSLVTLSDVVFIDEKAFLADPHVSVGLVAGDGGAVTFPLVMGLLKAKEYLFSGDRIPAEEAVRIGLANRLSDEGKSLEDALAYAERLARQPRRALLGTKRALNAHLSNAFASVLDLALSEESASFDCPEHRAALEKMRNR
jgi:enoyl-CoA hydratase